MLGKMKVLMMPSLGVLVYAAAAVVSPSQSFGADVSIHGFNSLEKNIDKIKLLKEKYIDINITGEILFGDYDKVLSIASIPVPIRRVFIRSNGGSVDEALKIANLIYEKNLTVVTDYQYQCDQEPRPSYLYMSEANGCGCASACALIWLLAPFREGSSVKVHRPYFEKKYFSNLPDAVAIDRYNSAISQVRDILSARGYSEDIIHKIFRTQSEDTELLSMEDISKLPINYAIDELAGARCIGEDGSKIAMYHHYTRESKKYPILSDERLKIMDEINALRGVISRYDQCKKSEIFEISVRKNSEMYLSSETREKISYFLFLIDSIFNAKRFGEELDLYVYKDVYDAYKLKAEILNEVPDNWRSIVNDIDIIQ